jgi:DNA (cytosine-5)-methyltransferase 1
MRLLDLFCGAGGCSVGYARAGFEVVGVDINPQPRYPYEFHQADALTYPLEGFDAIHASPPCQAFTSARTIQGRDHHDLLTPMRERLQQWGTAWAIENVVGAPMRADVLLCGSHFGLQTQRHRWFEFGFPYFSLLTPCSHAWGEDGPIGVYGHTGQGSKRYGNKKSGNHGWMVADWKRAMEIDWMSRDELAQAIPPAYTQFIGEQLLSVLADRMTA